VDTGKTKSTINIGYQSMVFVPIKTEFRIGNLYPKTLKRKSQKNCDYEKIKFSPQINVKNVLLMLTYVYEKLFLLYNQSFVMIDGEILVFKS